MPRCNLVLSLSFALWLYLPACGSGTPSGSTDAALDSTAETVAEAAADAAPDAAPEAEAVADSDADACGPLPLATAPSAFPWALESDDVTCANEKDDDGNGYTDCDDFGCSRNPAVTVCDAQAAWEHSPSACANGQDDDGDGLTDCADPDCARNPFHSVCGRPLRECDCAGDADTDGDEVFACADLDCLALEPTCQPPLASVRVLFDLTLDETAALGPNSDWVIDAGARVPSPSNPSSDVWTGALSAFGFELQARGFAVESLVAWEGHLSHGDATNPQDLARYGVLVLFEPSRGMTEPEKAAVLDFVVGGGGLLLVANHLGADRDGNGWSAPQVFDDLIDYNPRGADPFGFRFDLVDVDLPAPLDKLANPTHPVLDGPAGKVARVGFYQGCSARLTGTNPAALALVQLPDAPDVGTRIAVGAAQVRAGRVVFLTDSAIGGDGSDSHGNLNPSHDSWHNPQQDNRALLLNAVEWLGKRP